MGIAGVVAIAVVVAAIAMILRGGDVRLVLLLAALLIAAVADLTAWHVAALPLVVREFLATFSNEKFVVPICSAMGFAYVLRHTGCERHLVLLLLKPLRSVRGLLVPGVIVAGFLVNVPIISQTSTAVCIGPVVVPLMRAAGYSLPTIGACLLLGCSVGGELLNPGAPELLTVFALTGVPSQTQAKEYLPPLVFTQLTVATLAAWLLSRRWEAASTAKKRSGGEPIGSPFLGGTGFQRVEVKQHRLEAGATQEQADQLAARVNPVKALVPLVPLVLLFLAGPPFNVFHVPEEWLVKQASEKAAYSSRLIGLAMLLGVIAAMLAAPGKSRGAVKQFFEGAGYGFANIVSLIVTATCFGKAIESAGLAAALGRVIAAAPGLLEPLAALVPLAFAALAGSGMASTQSLYGFFFEPARALGHDPTAVGSLVAVAAAAGRTMSPVAAVTLMCATLTQTNPFTLAKRVAGPLLLGIAAVIALRLCGAF